MPNVGSNEFSAAKGANNFVSGIPMGKNGTTGGPNNDGWKYGMAVYAYNGAAWVEVWNARPEMVSSTFTVSDATTLSFSGTADPNNFATTATFEYKEVGGTYADANTTTTGLGNNIDGAVSFSVTKTEIDGFKNWEARAKGTNLGGTGYGGSLFIDCRKSPTVTWTESAVDNPITGTCNNRTYTTTSTWTRTGCPTYTTVSAPKAAPADCGAACYEAATVTEEYYDGSCGTRRYRTKTVTNPKTASNCPSDTTYGAPYASPTCEGTCTTLETVDGFDHEGQYLMNFGDAGYYFAILSPNCYCANPNCYATQNFYVTKCNGVRTVTSLGCGPCTSIFGDPC